MICQFGCEMNLLVCMSVMFLFSCLSFGLVSGNYVLRYVTRKLLFQVEKVRSGWRSFPIRFVECLCARFGHAKQIRRLYKVSFDEAAIC